MFSTMRGVKTSPSSKGSKVLSNIEEEELEPPPAAAGSSSPWSAGSTGGAGTTTVWWWWFPPPPSWGFWNLEGSGGDSAYWPVSCWTSALNWEALVLTFMGLDMYTTFMGLLLFLFLFLLGLQLLLLVGVLCCTLLMLSIDRSLIRRGNCARWVCYCCSR